MTYPCSNADKAGMHACRCERATKVATGRQARHDCAGRTCCASAQARGPMPCQSEWPRQKEDKQGGNTWQLGLEGGTPCSKVERERLRSAGYAPGPHWVPGPLAKHLGTPSFGVPYLQCLPAVWGMYHDANFRNDEGVVSRSCRCCNWLCKEGCECVCRWCWRIPVVWTHLSFWNGSRKRTTAKSSPSLLISARWGPSPWYLAPVSKCSPQWRGSTLLWHGDWHLSATALHKGVASLTGGEASSFHPAPVCAGDDAGVSLFF